MMNHAAIYKLYPVVTTILESKVFDADGNQVTIDMDAVNAWVDPDAYKYSRTTEYPSIGDQLDALFHAGVFPAEMATAIQAVKDKYPKETL
tara:strand:- start:1072 stop:1344 length:273 start_codon:yes stop_codon:yes gene_type:complete